MASVSTVSASVLAGPWSAESRKLPVWEYYETLTIWFDDRSHEKDGGPGPENYYTADFEFHTPHANRRASVVNGRSEKYGKDHAFHQGNNQYWTTPYKEHKHVNIKSVAYESDGGYEVFTNMLMYADLAGDAKAGEDTVSDKEGRQWDIVIPVFYYWVLVKDAKGIRAKQLTAIKDTGVADKRLVSRGMGHKGSIDWAGFKF